MKATISRPLQAGRTGLLRDTEATLIEHHNTLTSYYQARAKLTTKATNAATAIWTSDVMPFSSTLVVEAIVHGMSIGGATWLTARKAAGFTRGASGGITQLGAVEVIRQQTGGAPSMDILANASQQIQVNVDDNGADTFNWWAWINMWVSW